MIIICREVDRETGKTAVYPIKEDITEQMIFNLKLRSALNPELTYYFSDKSNYLGNIDSIISTLKRKRITEKLLERINIVKL